MSPAIEPRATYRLQLREGVTLDTAAELCDYLARLGISHLYTSPAHTAVPGSTHGYDVADPTSVDPVLGGEEAHLRLSRALEAAGLGRLVDIVPNHLAADPSNPWWRDVLDHGDQSEHARVFDVDWEAGGGSVVVDPVSPNYRRFFDISGLVGVRVEDDPVLEKTHELALSWVRRGEADGLRLDHPDGLRHPREYFSDLRSRSHSAWTLVEKILAPDEEIPADWEVDGTTGYEFCRRVTGVLVDPAAEEPLTELYADLTGETRSWEEVVRAAKADVLAGSLSSDLERLVRLTSAATGAGADEVRAELVRRLIEFPVYRDYPPKEAADHELRFAQLCAAVTAKGVEDTAFYRYTRFCALNEVGSEPGRWGCGVDEFHAANRRTLDRFPRTLLATATHDTKWGEDVRARLCLISEIPDQWAEFSRRHMEGPLTALEPFSAYALLQALVGAWPLPFDRAWTYLAKAMREAKSRTSWAAPDEDYEQGARQALRSLYDDDAFQADLASFARPLSAWGRVNSLAMLALKLMSPGVPDIYQGTELWDDALVDPDNRRPVDFAVRRQHLGGLEDPDPLTGMNQGLPKMRLTRAGLRLRQERPDSFGAGSGYTPATIAGREADRVVAFLRSDDVVLAAPRLGRAGAGRTAEAAVVLPRGAWHDVVTGATHAGGGAVSVADLWSRFPVSLMVRS